MKGPPGSATAGLEMLGLAYIKPAKPIFFGTIRCLTNRASKTEIGLAHWGSLIEQVKIKMRQNVEESRIVFECIRGIAHDAKIQRVKV